MKRAKALMTGLLVAASFVACDTKDSVGETVDSQLTMAFMIWCIARITSVRTRGWHLRYPSAYVVP